MGERFTLLEEVNHDIPGIERHLAHDGRLDRLTVVDIVHLVSAGAVRKVATRASRLRDPRLARIVATGRDTVEGRPVTYVAIEHVPGVTLDEVLATRRIDPRRAMAIVGGAARALAAARAEGLTHGFVRPGCITVTERGRVVVAGVGVDGEAAAQAGIVEQASEEADSRALGEILVRALTGLDRGESTADDLPDGMPSAGRAVALDVLAGAPPTTLGDLIDALSPFDARALVGFTAAVETLRWVPRLESEHEAQAAIEAARLAQEEAERLEASRQLIASETLEAARLAAEEEAAEALADPQLQETMRSAAHDEAAAVEETPLPGTHSRPADKHEAAFDTLEIMVADQNRVRERGTWELVLEALHRRWPASAPITHSLERARVRAESGGPLNGSRVVMTLAVAGIVLAVFVALAWLAQPLSDSIVIEPARTIQPRPVDPAAD